MKILFVILIKYSSAHHCSRRQKINHSYIGNNPVQPTGSRTATPGTKRPISVIFLTPEKEGRRGSLANLKALSAAERTKIEGKDSILLIYRMLTDFEENCMVFTSLKTR